MSEHIDNGKKKKKILIFTGEIVKFILDATQLLESVNIGHFDLKSIRCGVW